MRLGLVADLHANLPALMGVVGAAVAAGCDDLWCLGDVIGRGPHPNEVVDEIRRLRLPTVLGNWDEAVATARPSSSCQWPSPAAEAAGTASLAWTSTVIREDHRDWLRNLPVTNRGTFDEISVLAFHGTPYRTTEYLWSDRPIRAFSRIAADEGDGVFAFGHGHEQFHKVIGVANFVTPGAAGSPPTAGRAPWAVVDFADGSVIVTFLWAPYDHEGVAADLRTAGLDPDLLAQAPEAHLALRSA